MCEVISAILDLELIKHVYHSSWFSVPEVIYRFGEIWLSLNKLLKKLYANDLRCHNFYVIYLICMSLVWFDSKK